MSKDATQNTDAPAPPTGQNESKPSSTPLTNVWPLYYGQKHPFIAGTITIGATVGVIGMGAALYFESGENNAEKFESVVNQGSIKATPIELDQPYVIEEAGGNKSIVYGGISCPLFLEESTTEKLETGSNIESASDNFLGALGLDSATMYEQGHPDNYVEALSAQIEFMNTCQERMMEVHEIFSSAANENLTEFPSVSSALKSSYPNFPSSQQLQFVEPN